jgi:preprotein translocase SecE subunit
MYRKTRRFFSVCNLTPNSVNYFKDSFEELKKVTWPTNNHALKVTVLTVIFTAISTLVLTAFDFSFSKGYDALIELSPKASSNRDTQQAEVDQAANPIKLDSPMIQAQDTDGNPVNVTATPVPVE